MDLFLREATERIGADEALSKIDVLMDWPSFSPILKRGLGRSGVGPQGYDPLVLFKFLLIGQWQRSQAGAGTEGAAGFHDLLWARSARPGTG